MNEKRSLAVSLERRRYVGKSTRSLKLAIGLQGQYQRVGTVRTSSYADQHIALHRASKRATRGRAIKARDDVTTRSTLTAEPSSSGPVRSAPIYGTADKSPPPPMNPDRVPARTDAFWFRRSTTLPRSPLRFPVAHPIFPLIRARDSDKGARCVVQRRWYQRRRIHLRPSPASRR